MIHKNIKPTTVKKIIIKLCTSTKDISLTKRSIIQIYYTPICSNEIKGEKKTPIEIPYNLA